MSKSSGAILALLFVSGCSSDARRDRGDAPADAPATVGALSPPRPSTGPDLIVSESWVNGATNGLGIQGAFFTYGDGSGRTSITADAARSRTGFCVAGTSAEVLGGDFGGTYGAVAALNLQQEMGSDATRPYDATAHGVVGFGFEVVGNTGGALRFVIKQYATHDGFCVDNVPDCANGCSAEYRIDELAQNCWTPGGSAPVATSLQALEWQITTKEGEPTDFDYCVENIHAVVDPALAPVPAAPPAQPEVEDDFGPAY